MTLDADAAPPGEPGARLDPSVAALLAESSDSDTPPWRDLPLSELRERWLTDLRQSSGPGNPAVTSRDLRVPGSRRRIPIRIYQPTVPSRPAALLVYLHGGGFIFGDLDTHDAICRDIVAVSGLGCVAVGYSLSPEHRFPAALQDCVDTMQWLHEHIDEITTGPARIGLAGDSSGGNLAAAASLMLRDRGLPMPAVQLLIYPVLDLTMTSGSADAFGPEYGLSSADLAWFYDAYLGRAGDPRDPYISPALADDLSGLPPAHIITVGFDPLRDEGKNYVTSLRAAGVSATNRHYPGLIHGVLEFGAVLPVGRAFLEDVAKVLAQELALSQARELGITLPCE
jgi:acetyl esterase